MRKWTIVLAGTVLAAAGLVGALVHLNQPKPRRPTLAQASAAASATPTPEPSSAATVVRPADSSASDRRDYSLLPDGRPVPPLPANAPKQVDFGVILYTFSGAQFAPRDARSKADALELAKHSMELAQQDFFEASKKGDPGSTANAGSISRGFLEPAIEFVLFSLEKGKVHTEPLETPRGYWIVRRNR